MASLGTWTAAVVFAAALSAPASAGTPNPAFDAAQRGVVRSFLSHAPGQPTVTQTVAVAPGLDQGLAQVLQGLIQEVSEVQLGCAAPCDPAGYLERVRAAGAKLKLPADQLALAQERYAPGGMPRLRPVSGAPNGASGDGGGPERTDLQSFQLDQGRQSGQRTSRTATGMADALRLDRQAETIGGGGVAGGSLNNNIGGNGRYNAQDAIAAYTASGSGGSRTMLDRRIVAPPTLTTAGTMAKKPLEPLVPPLTTMQRAALWVGDRISPEALQRASDFSAGMGDTLSFGATKWIRKKMGTDHVVNEGSGANMAGSAAGIAVSMFVGGGIILKPFTKATQMVTRWAPGAEKGALALKEGQFVMAGQATLRNKLMGGIHELKWKYGSAYDIVKSVEVPGKLLRYPIKEEGLIRGVWKGLMGQRVYVGPTVPL